MESNIVTTLSKMIFCVLRRVSLSSKNILFMWNFIGFVNGADRVAGVDAAWLKFF